MCGHNNIVFHGKFAATIDNYNKWYTILTKLISENELYFLFKKNKSEESHIAYISVSRDQIHNENNILFHAGMKQLTCHI